MASIRDECIRLTKEKLEDSFGEEYEVIELIRLYDDSERFCKQLESRPSKEKEAMIAAANSSMKEIKKKIEDKLKNFAPELLKESTPIIAARLLKAAGSMKKLSSMPSSKIQLLGAEKALFTHLKTGSKPPKHGLIIDHPSIQKAENKGKAARQLASKIAIAARKDFYGKK